MIFAHSYFMQFMLEIRSDVSVISICVTINYNNRNVTDILSFWKWIPCQISHIGLLKRNLELLTLSFLWNLY